MSVQPVLEAPDPKPATDTRAAEPDPSEHLRTQFLRRIAHDIASPTGVTLTVLEELASANRPRPELVAMARRSLRRLMRLSEHLALVAELETEPLQPEVSATDIRSLTKQALDDALAVDGRKDVVVACNLPASTMVIEGDTRLLVVALREIIGNALRMATSRVEVGVAAASTPPAPGSSVVVRVDDDGAGFAPDALATLGRRFVRRSAMRGLGLSLSMAVDILKAHGGTLTVESSRLPPGRRGVTGAGMVVTIPMGKPAGPNS